MALDPVLIADTRSWLIKAANDLRGAEIDLNAEPPLLEDTLFHCQQAAEKSFKAFLTFHDRPFRKTHNLAEIGKACAEIDNELGTIVMEAAGLTEFAWAFRYPGEPWLPNVEEVQARLLTARKVFETVLGRVPAEAHP